jgi:hypothetical protein
LAKKTAIFIHAPTSLGILIHNFILPMSEHFLKLILDNSDSISIAAEMSISIILFPLGPYRSIKADLLCLPRKLDKRVF